MSEHGSCARCGKEIQLDMGYSNLQGSMRQRMCITCQFPEAALEPERSRSRGFLISAAAVERIGISFLELSRRSRVAKEAHSVGKVLTLESKTRNGDS